MLKILCKDCAFWDKRCEREGGYCNHYDTYTWATDYCEDGSWHFAGHGPVYKANMSKKQKKESAAEFAAKLTLQEAADFVGFCDYCLEPGGGIHTWDDGNDVVYSESEVREFARKQYELERERDL